MIKVNKDFHNIDSDDDIIDEFIRNNTNRLSSTFSNKIRTNLEGYIMKQVNNHCKYLSNREKNDLGYALDQLYLRNHDVYKYDNNNVLDKLSGFDKILDMKFETIITSDSNRFNIKVHNTGRYYILLMFIPMNEWTQIFIGNIER